MAQDNLRATQARFGRAVEPAQHLGSMLLENMERMADYQFELMQSYTHFTMRQWRDALEIRDPESFGEYLRKQNERVREFGEKLNDDSRRLIRLGEQSGREALRTSERAARGVGQFAERAAEQAQKAQEDRRAQPAGDSKLPIEDYDELSASDIEQRSEKLDVAQIRQLLRHERASKNRKTVIEAFERRL